MNTVGQTPCVLYMCGLVLTQTVAEVGKKTIKCLTTELSLCRCTYQKH